MDLDEMKIAWSDMSVQLEQQKKLTNEIILKMTQEKSHSKLNNIIMMESMGMIVTAIALVYIIINFYKFDNWLEITGGIGTCLILILALVFGSILIKKAKRINLVKDSFSDTISHFTAFKKLLGYYKRLSIVINVFGAILIIPVTFALFSEKDILENLAEAGRALIAAAFLVPIVLWLIIKFYKRNIGAVNTAFKNLNDNK